ncbi:GntR family transcriptional regulator [Pantoea cypripedii]|uniref:GntR family transcriptional regulator n=1 Tax=Pantoea cypripedii TaxID=55209 RepID=A0A6B9GH97_PANCY|nr:GntR family transcriptional regulator [Pantoea cypripedii]QGY33035.1 GntR family transcriptional regulator [Pantoea cypripedii]
MADFERPKSLTALVTDHVRKLIVHGDIPLGAAISERTVAAELNVSKTPVREALAQLSIEGLVTIKPQSGVRVFTLSAREVREICAFRQVLETAALTLAMQQDAKGLAEALDAVVKQMDLAQSDADFRRYLELDNDFHQCFFDFCGNTYLTNSYVRYAAKIAALRTHLAAKPQHTSLSYQEHGDIVAAIRKDAGAEVQAILERHLGRTRETYEIGIEDIAAADAAPLTTSS